MHLLFIFAAGLLLFTSFTSSSHVRKEINFPPFTSLSNGSNILARCTNTEVILNFKTMEELCFVNLSGNKGCHRYELTFEQVNKFRVPCTLTTLIPSATRIRSVEIFGGGKETNHHNYIEFKYDLDGSFLRINTTLNISLHSILDSYFLQNVTTMIFTEIKTGMAQEFLNYEFRAPHLEKLVFFNSDIQKIDILSLIQNQNLKDIQVNGIELKNLTLNKGILKQVTRLNFSNCDLRQILWEGKKEFLKSSLEVLDLSRNKLRKIPEFLVGALGGIKVLNLEENFIDTGGCSFYHLGKFLFKIDPEIWVRTDFNNKAFSMPDLVNCSWDECPFLCNCDSHSKTVDCSSKGLTNVPEIGPSEAEILLLKNNSLTNEGLSLIFQQKPWCNLRQINMARNQMSQIMPEWKIQGVCECRREVGLPRPVLCFLPRLTNLTLSFNALSAFSSNDWKLIRRCSTADLSHNKISEHAFMDKQDYSMNQFLNLSFNRLRILNKSIMKLFPFIVHLNLSNNYVQDINFHMTSQTPLLQVLDLSNNVLHTLAPSKQSSRHTDRFPDPYTISLPSLEALYLHNNNLRSINPTLWHSLKYLTLRNNNWNCSYTTVADMQYFIWKNLEANVVSEFKNLKCRNGTYLHDIEIPDVFEKENCKEKSFVLVSCTIAIFAVVSFFGSSLWKYFAFYFKKYIFHRKVQNEVAEREFDVFVYYCDDDTEKVNSIISKLLNLNFKVIHPKDFIFKGPNMGQFKEALSSSRRMIAIISENFFKDQTCIFGLDKGIKEEMLVRKFKIACFYIENVQTPSYIDLTMREFLECNCIKQFPNDMWERNLQKFIQEK